MKKINNKRKLSTNKRSKHKIVNKSSSVSYKKNINKNIKSYYHNDKPVFSIIGQLQNTQKGFGFVIVPNGEDIFVAKRNYNGANHGDTVRVEVYNSNIGLEGKIVAIVEKNNKNIVGTLKIDNSDIAFVVPDDIRYGDEFCIAKQHLNGAIDNDKVVIDVLNQDSSKHNKAKVVKILGQSGSTGVDILSILNAYGLQTDFDSKVLKETKILPSNVMQDELNYRVDYRQDIIVTIDSEDTKDIDDAISVVKTDDGYILSVHIADVSHYVLQGTEIDKEAFKRGTSTYFANSVIPMLPPQLSNGICSLNPDENRLTLSLIMYIDKYGKVYKHELNKGVVKTIQLTYNLVMQILSGTCQQSEYINLKPMLDDCVNLSQILTSCRKKRGSIDFDLPETKMIFDSNMHPIDIQKKERNIAHILIEEFMLIANETIAKKFDELKIPFVYRVHTSPEKKKLESLLSFVKVFGIQLKGDLNNLKPINIQEMLNSVAGTEIGQVLNNIALKAQMKATYEDINLGHFGLAASHYCHFTSPIRRYPDLMIHRIISQFLVNPQNTKSFSKITKQVAKQSSIRERVSIEVERKILDIKKAQYMQDKIGQLFQGRISGIISNAIFVELDNTIEGRVGIKDLPKDDYELDNIAVSLKGRIHKYKLCDKVEVVVQSVIDDKINFVFKSN